MFDAFLSRPHVPPVCDVNVVRAAVPVAVLDHIHNLGVESGLGVVREGGGSRRKKKKLKKVKSRKEKNIKLGNNHHHDHYLHHHYYYLDVGRAGRLGFDKQRIL
jgi:hypothetical protein